MARDDEKEKDAIEGPPMICATKVLRPGGHRIGRIAGGFSLPRTVPVGTAALTLVFAALGLLLAFAVGVGVASYGLGAGVGGMIGYALATFSPMRGESMSRWLLLTLTSAGKKRKIDGKPVTLAVGVSVANRVPVGNIRIRQGAIRVKSGSVDDRGIPIKRENVST